MQNILRTLILVSSVYVPGLCLGATTGVAQAASQKKPVFCLSTLQEQLAVIKKTFDALQKQQQPALRDLIKLRKAINKLSQERQDNRTIAALRDTIIKFCNEKQMGTLSGPLTISPNIAAPQDKARQKFLKARERLEKVQKKGGSGLTEDEWEDYENGLESNSKEKTQAKALRMKLFQESFEKFKKDKKALSPKELTEAYQDYLTESAYFANRYNDDASAVQVCAEIKAYIKNELQEMITAATNKCATSTAASSAQAASAVDGNTAAPQS